MVGYIISTKGVVFANFYHHMSELKICHNGLVVVMTFRYHFSTLFPTYLVWDYNSCKQFSPGYVSTLGY